MLQLIEKNRIIFIFYFLVLISFTAILAIMGKMDMHLWLTGFHSHFTDSIMQLITFLGDGLFMVLTGILLLFRRLRYGLIILSSFVINSVMVQLLKRLIFTHDKRPVSWFHDRGIEIYRIPGVEYHSFFSFPSGHSATAFALFFGLAFFVKTSWLKFLLVFFAVVTAYSRVYLSQHFLGDALAGSIIGLTIAVFFQLISGKINRVWIDESIITLLRKKNV